MAATTLEHLTTMLQMGRLSRRQFMTLAMMVAGGAAASAALVSVRSDVAAQDGGEGGGTLIIGRQDDITTLDPWLQTATPTRQVYDNIYDGLVYTDPEMQIQGKLAESWEQIDDVTYRFKIRQGVTFHCGAELTAHDVKYTFDRLLGKLPDSDRAGRPATFLTGIESIEVEDDFTVVFTSPAPYGAFMNDLTPTWNGIVHREHVEERGEQFGENPCGSGPFQFEEWARGQYVSLTRFDGYWGEKPGIARVEFRVIPDEATRSLAYETGEIDMLFSVPKSQITLLESRDDTEVLRLPTLRTIYFAFNVEQPPVTDALVRRAIAHALPREDIVAFILEGVGQPAEGFMSPLVFGYAPVELPAYDLEQAAALMEEAGWQRNGNGIWEQDGQPFTAQLATTGGDEDRRLVEGIQAFLGEFGLGVELLALEDQAYQTAQQAGEFPLFIHGYGVQTGDADMLLYTHFHRSLQFPNSRRYTFYGNDTMDELLDQAKRSIDQDERQAIYAEIQQMLLEGMPLVPLYQTVETAAVRQTVEGFVMHPAEHIRLWNVSMNEG